MRVSIPYGTRQGILPTRMRKRLRYLMPALPQSLIVRLVTPRVVSPQCWKTGSKCGTNLP